MEQTQQMYEKKNNLIYPCMYDNDDLSDENLGNFEFLKHKEEHKSEPEERC